MVSVDGGESWHNNYHCEIDNPWFCDIKQTEDNLIILGTESLYFIKKNDLLSSSGLQEVDTNDSIPCDDKIYSIEGTVIKCHADENDLNKLPKGIYIYKRNKIIVK